MSRFLFALGAGDDDAIASISSDIEAIGRACGDADVQALGALCRGEAALHRHDAGARRPLTLAAATELFLGAGDVDEAVAACEQLDALVDVSCSPLARAIADHAAGVLALASGEAQTALARLRAAASSVALPVDALPRRPHRGAAGVGLPRARRRERLPA